MVSGLCVRVLLLSLLAFSKHAGALIYRSSHSSGIKPYFGMTKDFAYNQKPVSRHESAAQPRSSLGVYGPEHVSSEKSYPAAAGMPGGAGASSGSTLNGYLQQGSRSSYRSGSSRAHTPSHYQNVTEGVLQSKDAMWGLAPAQKRNRIEAGIVSSYAIEMRSVPQQPSNEPQTQPLPEREQFSDESSKFQPRPHPRPLPEARKPQAQPHPFPQQPRYETSKPQAQLFPQQPRYETNRHQIQPLAEREQFSDESSKFQPRPHPRPLPEARKPQAQPHPFPQQPRYETSKPQAQLFPQQPRYEARKPQAQLFPQQPRYETNRHQIQPLPEREQFSDESSKFQPRPQPRPLPQEPRYEASKPQAQPHPFLQQPRYETSKPQAQLFPQQPRYEARKAQAQPHPFPQQPRYETSKHQPQPRTEAKSPSEGVLQTKAGMWDLAVNANADPRSFRPIPVSSRHLYRWPQQQAASYRY